MEWKVQDYLYSLEGMQCMSRIFWNKVFNLQLLRVLASSCCFIQLPVLAFWQSDQREARQERRQWRRGPERSGGVQHWLINLFMDTIWRWMESNCMY